MRTPLQTTTALAALALTLTACTPTADTAQSCPAPVDTVQARQTAAIQAARAASPTLFDPRTDDQAAEILDLTCQTIAETINGGKRPIEGAWAAQDTIKQSGVTGSEAQAVVEAAIDGYCPDFRRFPQLNDQ